MLLDYLFLPVLFFIGLVTSYQDFKEGKIKNKWILLGLIWGLGIYLFFLIWALIAPTPFILPSYILKVFINSAIALIVGYLLWYFNLWSAGDAKLFFVFSLLLPLKYYWRTALPYFPSFVLLINIFIPVLLFLIGQNLFYFFRSISITKIVNFQSSCFAKLKINYPAYLKTAFGFLLIFLFFQIIMYEFSNLGISQFGQWQSVAFLLIITIIRKSLNQFFQKTWVLSLGFLGIIFYLVIGQFFFFQEPLSKIFLFLKDSIFLISVFIIVSALLSYASEREEHKKHLPFAIWLLIGVFITIVLQGSLLSLFLNPSLFF